MKSLALCVLVAACSSGDSAQTDAGTDREPPPLGSAPAAPTPKLRVVNQPTPGALQELLAKVPKAQPAAAASIGSDTGEPGSAEVVTVDGRHRTVRAGRIEVQPQLSSPAIERAAREQIYWSLRRCTGPDGKSPPPESITLMFNINPDGSVDPASVSAEANAPELEPTAECVLAAFSASPFRGPAATRKTSARVIITWPSVD